jgi:hypothetical protein
MPAPANQQSPRVPMLTFDVLSLAWAERAGRRPSRCAVAGAPAPPSPPQVRWIAVAIPSRRCKPRDGQAPFTNPRTASGSLLPRFLPNRNFPWIHHIHPIHRHHTAPTHPRNHPTIIPFCLVQLKIAIDTWLLLRFAIYVWTIPARFVQIYLAISVPRATRLDVTP